MGDGVSRPCSGGVDRGWTWTWAGAFQPDGYDPVRDTIGALPAEPGTADVIMTGALTVLGGCPLVTAAGLTGAGWLARALSALIAFLALGPWPATSGLPGRRAALLGALMLLTLLGWLALELRGRRHPSGHDAAPAIAAAAGQKRQCNI